jgi:DNA-binding beta-propeller fold protein YncE
MTPRLVTALLLVMTGTAPAADMVTLVADKLTQPFAVAFDATGDALFVEMVGGERVRKVTKGGEVVTLAGTGKKGYVATSATANEAEFNGLHDLAVSKSGGVLLADTFNHAIQVYDDPKGTVARFAGSGKPGFAGNGGPATDAQFNQPICLFLHGNTLYVADIGNRRVRAIDLKTQEVRTVAGTGVKGTPTDGELAVTQPLTDPRAIAVDTKGTLYVLERGGHRLYAIGTDGKIFAVAGTGAKGNSGNGGPALKAAMNGPKYVAIDRDDSVLIADTENHQIRRYNPADKTMSLVAGTGKAGKHFDADPLKLELKRPHGVTVEPKTGDIWVADSENGRILKITHAPSP